MMHTGQEVRLGDIHIQNALGDVSSQDDSLAARRARRDDHVDGSGCESGSDSGGSGGSESGSGCAPTASPTGTPSASTTAAPTLPVAQSIPPTQAPVSGPTTAAPTSPGPFSQITVTLNVASRRERSLSDLTASEQASLKYVVVFCTACEIRRSKRRVRLRCCSDDRCGDGVVAVAVAVWWWWW
jgi:hypothetical protein